MRKDGVKMTSSCINTAQYHGHRKHTSVSIPAPHTHTSGKQTIIMKKRSERREHCARAGCSNVRTPPSCPPVANTRTHRQDRQQYTAPRSLARSVINCNAVPASLTIPYRLVVISGVGVPFICQLRTNASTVRSSFCY